MNKRNLLIAVGIIALLIAAYIIFCPVASRGNVIGEGITVYRTTIADKPTHQAFIYVPFKGDAKDYTVANVALDINGDGKFEAYDTAAGKQEEWVVVNDMADAVPDEATRLVFSVVDPDFGKQPMKGLFVISKKEFAEGVWPAEAVAKEKYTKTFAIASVILEARDQNRSNDKTGVLATGFPLLEANVAYAQAPAIPAPAPAPVPAQQNAGPYAKHDGVPDQDQRYNECAPTGISNSFRWLAKTYGVNDRIPQEPSDLIDELKGDLNWSDGVAHDNVIKGKQAFIDRHQLPFEAHQIGTEHDPELIKKIRDEIARGQAVEVWLQMENASGTIVGAHLVTVAGAGFLNDKNIITFMDPDTTSPDGHGSRDVYRVAPTNFLPNYVDGIRTFIRYAYAQSPTQALIDHTWVDPRSPTAIAVTAGGNITLDPPGTTRVASRSKFGFFAVTLPSPGDHYVGDSFTYEVAVDKQNIERSRDYWQGGVLKTWKYKAGSPWVLSGVFRSSGPVSPSEIKDRPTNMSVSGNRATAADRFTCTAPGVATISYALGVGWIRVGDPVPPAILNSAHGAEFNETNDTMTVSSPPFRCIPKESATPGKSESHTSVLDSFCPGFTEDSSGMEMDVLRAGNECYPTVQFHQAHPDKCDAPHWHATMGAAKSLTGAVWVDPSGCGFGKVKDVPAGKVKLSPDQAAPFVDAVKR